MNNFQRHRSERLSSVIIPCRARKSILSLAVMSRYDEAQKTPPAAPALVLAGVGRRRGGVAPAGQPEVGQPGPPALRRRGHARPSPPSAATSSIRRRSGPPALPPRPRRPSTIRARRPCDRAANDAFGAPAGARGLGRMGSRRSTRSSTCA